MGVSGKCGTTLASSCVFYTGKDFTFVDVNDQLTCDASVSDAFEKVDKYLKELIDGNNFTALTPDCLSFNPATVTAKDLHQLEITEICLLKGQVTTLTNSVNNLNIGNEVITINLGCLTDDASSCAVATNQYQLITLLTLFANKLCEFETRISNLES